MSNTPSSSMNKSSGELLSDEEDIDDPSSNTSEVEDVLASFREMWQKELKISSKTNPTPKSTQNDLTEEQRARNSYLEGAKLERAGKLYEAIQFYKRAVQLVPDIEFKIHEKSIASIQTGQSSDDDTDVEELQYDEIHEIDSDEEEEIKEGGLLARIQRKVNKSQWFCVPEYEQRTTHISCIPMEILLYIFKWVVSSDLDLRSLEMCSMVSRGFYLCARDEEIWKLACLRSWGVNCGNLSNLYPTWRQMFLNRDRLHYNGCYISKTTYIRHGENSFQDQFYRPWHLVAYYRYLRFFPDGLVLMLTTSDEPVQCVSLLKNRSAKIPTVLIGHYRLKEDKVTIVVQHQDLTPQSNNYKRGRKRNDMLYESGEKTFHLELQIQHTKRIQDLLVWTHYSVITRHRNGTENKSSFEIINNRFPPLWFSRVKSYTQESYSPLQ